MDREIIEYICSLTGISPDEINKDTRKRAYVFTRQLICKTLKGSVKDTEIATLIGRDRTSVISGRKRIENDVKHHKYTREIYEKVKNFRDKVVL